MGSEYLGLSPSGVNLAGIESQHQSKLIGFLGIGAVFVVAI